MNWLETRLSPFESDWMALHRFLWLNAVDGAAFWKILTAHTPTRAAAITAPQDFGSEMQKWAATTEAGRSVSAKGVDRVLGDSAHLFATFDAVRYCPECLANAFHSHIFQVTAIARCPVHGHALVSACQHCGTSLKGTALRPAFFAKPLSCDHCGTPFGPYESAMITADE